MRAMTVWIVRPILAREITTEDDAAEAKRVAKGDVVCGDAGIEHGDAYARLAALVAQERAQVGRDLLRRGCSRLRVRAGGRDCRRPHPCERRAEDACEQPCARAVGLAAEHLNFSYRRRSQMAGLLTG